MVCMRRGSHIHNDARREREGEGERGEGEGALASGRMERRTSGGAAGEGGRERGQS